MPVLFGRTWEKLWKEKPHQKILSEKKNLFSSKTKSHLCLLLLAHPYTYIFTVLSSSCPEACPDFDLAFAHDVCQRNRSTHACSHHFSEQPRLAFSFLFGKRLCFSLSIQLFKLLILVVFSLSYF